MVIQQNYPQQRTLTFRTVGGAKRRAPQTGKYVLTGALASLHLSLLQDHLSSFHCCIVGNRGSGKSHLVKYLAASLGNPWLSFSFTYIVGYNLRTIQLYKDMTSRDLLQRRSTNDVGDTCWMNSPIGTAAIQVCKNSRLYAIVTQEVLYTDHGREI